MPFSVELHSSAAPEAVLTSIREEMREWRESALPPALRRRAWQVAARIDGSAFRLYYESSSEAGPDVVLRGSVHAAAGGGSRVVAGVESPYAGWVSLVLFVLLGLLLWSWAGALLGLLLGAALSRWSAWRESRLSPETDLETRHLVERLERAVAAAGPRGPRVPDRAV